MKSSFDSAVKCFYKLLTKLLYGTQIYNLLLTTIIEVEKISCNFEKESFPPIRFIKFLI